MTQNKVCCQDLNDILQSVALEETALSHILNAEGEKIQKALLLATNVDELIQLNRSVQNTIMNITALESVLFGKMYAAVNTECVDCPIQPNGSITFYVYSCTTNLPLCGITVRVYNDCMELVGSGVTNANGVYYLGNLKNGTYRVVVCDPISGQEQSYMLTIDDAQKNVFGQTCFTREEHTALALYVYDCNEQIPLPNINVKLLDSQCTLVDEKNTDQNGLYGKDKLPFDQYTLVMTNPATGEIKKQSVTIDHEHRIVETEQCFVNEIVITGIIRIITTVCESGRPLAGIEVVIKNAVGVIVVESVTNSMGQYVTPPLPLGVYVVALTDPVTGEKTEKIVNLTEQTREVEIAVCLQQCVNDMVRISGVVEDNQGNRLKNATVIATGLSTIRAKTDSCGKYVIPKLRVCNEFQIMAECDGQRSTIFRNANPIKSSYIYNFKIKI